MAEDRYSNILAGTVTETGANTITFDEINLPVSLATRRGILIDEVRYFPNAAALNDLVAEGDVITAGVVTSENVTDLNDPTDRRILDQFALTAHVNGTAASGLVAKAPYIHQLFPPIIFAGQRIFFALAGVGLDAAATMRFRLHYRFIDLTPAEYLEIAETFQLSS